MDQTTGFAVFAGGSYLRVGGLFKELQSAVDFAVERNKAAFFGGETQYVMEFPPRSIDNNDSGFPYCGFSVAATVDKRGVRYYTDFITHFSIPRFWLSEK